MAAEFAKPPKSKGEVLVFPAGKIPCQVAKTEAVDVEAQPLGRQALVEKSNVKGSGDSDAGLAAGTAVFHWENLCYDITIKGNGRRILDQVDGWVKPSSSTALMAS